MYEQVNIQNTYACITETANSNPIKAINIEKGIRVKIDTNILLENICPKNVDNIFIKVWPLSILANNLIPNEKALAKYETNSIKVNKGTNTNGVPPGIK